MTTGDTSQARRARLARRAQGGSRLLVIVACVVAVVIGSTGLAFALWMSSQNAVIPAIERGTVMFAAEDPSDPSTIMYSSASGSSSTPTSATGTPVTVTMPGPVIAQVGTDPQGHVVWRFEVSGYATGSAGMDYDLAYPVVSDGTPGVINTYLEGSTLKVYPAGAGGDCSNVPASMPDPVNGTVTVSDQELDEPGPNSTATVLTQVWCADITWNAAPAGRHTNIATLTATTEQHESIRTTDTFTALISYPPVLSPIGGHANTATVRAVGENTIVAYDHSIWTSVISPNPDDEPGLVFTATPHVTTPSAADPA